MRDEKTIEKELENLKQNTGDIGEKDDTTQEQQLEKPKTLDPNFGEELDVEDYFRIAKSDSTTISVVPYTETNNEFELEMAKVIREYFRKCFDSPELFDEDLETDTALELLNVINTEIPKTKKKNRILYSFLDEYTEVDVEDEVTNKYSEYILNEVYPSANVIDKEYDHLDPSQIITLIFIADGGKSGVSRDELESKLTKIFYNKSDIYGAIDTLINKSLVNSFQTNGNDRIRAEEEVIDDLSLSATNASESKPEKEFSSIDENTSEPKPEKEFSLIDKIGLGADICAIVSGSIAILLLLTGIFYQGMGMIIFDLSLWNFTARLGAVMIGLASVMMAISQSLSR